MPAEAPVTSIVLPDISIIPCIKPGLGAQPDELKDPAREKTADGATSAVFAAAGSAVVTQDLSTLYPRMGRLRPLWEQVSPIW